MPLPIAVPPTRFKRIDLKVDRTWQPALYLAGHIAFRLRNVRTWNRQRVVAAILLTALVVPVRAGLPALLALACVTAVLVALVLYEEIRFGEHRDELKERIAAQHR